MVVTLQPLSEDYDTCHPRPEDIQKTSSKRNLHPPESMNARAKKPLEMESTDPTCGLQFLLLSTMDRAPSRVRDPPSTPAIRCTKSKTVGPPASYGQLEHPYNTPCLFAFGMGNYNSRTASLSLVDFCHHDEGLLPASAKPVRSLAPCQSSVLHQLLSHPMLPSNQIYLYTFSPKGERGRHCSPAKHYTIPVSYTHLTLPTIYSV